MKNEKNNLTDDQKNKEHSFLKFVWLFTIFSFMTAFVVFGTYYLKKIPKIVNLGPRYVQAYELVSDSVSKSASIKINLPKGVTGEEVMSVAVFNPEIKGKWASTTVNDVVLFTPVSDLEVGKYYSVSIDTPQGKIGKDFKVEENPEVISVFPKANSEVHEKSDITILFNRPMVPLTTLDMLDGFDVPVEISPKTEGKFKWIGSRSLQFKPDDTLIPSSNYFIKIKSDFVSLDGLHVENFEQKFITRPLRLEGVTSGKNIYSKPIKVRFNQEVDLEKTKAEIWLKDTFSDVEIDFVATYGEKKIYDKKKEEYETTVDRSVILIYNKEDKHGREELWDFKTNYFVKIEKAYPVSGDIIWVGGNNLRGGGESHIQVPDIIESITAESERSRFVNQDFFDAQGRLWVKFYEDIDLGKSRINVGNLEEKGYGEKCIDTETTYVNYSTCEKEEDKSKIFFKFDSSKIEKGSTLKLNFEEVVSVNDFQINADTIVRDVKVVPDLLIYRTIPADKKSGASLTEFYMCSNTPIVPVKKDFIDEYLELSDNYEFKSWATSRLVPKNNNNYYKCNVGEFQTRISYGLIPSKDYNFKLKAVDHFDSEFKFDINFKTASMASKDLNFFHLQKKYNVTTPDKTVLTYAAWNMDYVDMHICRLSAEHMLYRVESKPEYWNGPSPSRDCSEIVEKKIDLEDRYWVKNYFKVNLSDYVDDTNGHFIITFSHPNYKERWGQYRKVYERTYLTATNLSIVEKEIKIESRDFDRNVAKETIDSLKNIYWVSNLKTLEPINEARVEIFSNKGRSLIKAKTVYTNKSGIAETTPVDKTRGVVVTHGSDSAIISDNTLKFGWNSSAQSQQKVYVYTDRPIYKPGDEVNIKGLYRIGYDGDYEIFRDKKLKVEIKDASRKNIFNEELEINEFGTFNFKIILDKSASLGKYNIRLLNGFGYASFDVEEYVPAPFKLESVTDKEEYISGDTMKLELDASYYFGAPVEGGEVTYSIGSQDYHFDKYKGEYFVFGREWYRCWWGCDYGDKFIYRGKTELGENGKVVISKQLDIDKLFKEESERKSKILTVYMTVINRNGQSVSSQKSLIVHKGNFYLGVKTDKRFFASSESFNVKAKSVNTEGEDLKVKNVKLTISKIEWIRNKRKEVDGGYYYKWEEKLEKKIEKTFDTNNNGLWDDNFKLDENGSYEIKIEASDVSGNAINSKTNMYVWGNGQASVRPNNDTDLEIVAENTSLDVGDEASIIIKSPYKKAKALVGIERGKIFDYEILDIDQSLYNYKFKIREEHIPNVFASVVLLSPDPGVKYGNVNFQVNTKEKELDIVVKPGKDHYLPGEEVELNFEVKNSNGEPVEAELSTAVVDLSVLALKGNPKKNPVIFFYSGFPLYVSTITNVNNVLYEVDVPDATKGGGGSESADLARKKRGIFKDTAFWKGVINTDGNGKASVKFTLPDNLTTWQVESVGLTKDTKLGVSYEEFVARKNIMLTPLKPRFTVPGDKFFIGAKVFNQTNETQKLEVQFSSDSLILNDKVNKSVNLKAKESNMIYFNVEAPSNKTEGIHSFIMSAKNEKYEDTVEKTISITRNDTYETTATANYTKENTALEYVFLPDNIIKEKGELTINHSATMAVFLSDALDYLFQYPYGCAEQVASKLKPIAIIKKGLALENIGDKYEEKMIEFDGGKYTIDQVVEIGLARIRANQNHDGGFSYYPGYTSSFHGTLHIMTVLSDLKEAGYDVKETEIWNAVKYVMNREQSRYAKHGINDLILGSYSITQTGNNITKFAAGKINEIESNEKFLNEELNNVYLPYLAIILSENNELFSKAYKDKVYKILENRIEIDARGAFLPASSQRAWWNYETSIKNTGMLLKALTIDERDNQILDRVIRWLLRSRSKDGAWGSTNNTVTIIDAMTEYLIWQEENKSNFTLSIDMNGVEKSKFTYGPETILEQNSFITQIKDLSFGELNKVEFKKENHNELGNNVYYDMALKYYLPIDSIPPRDEGFTVMRGFYGLDDKDFENEVTKAKVGDVLKGHIEVIVPKQRNFVAIEDYIPAGVELVNFNLSTENKALKDDVDRYGDASSLNKERDYWYYRNQYDDNLYPDIQEMRNDRMFLFKENLNPGTYTFDYFVRVLVPGKFHHLPAVVSEMYFPENFGRGRGDYFEVVR